MAWQGKRVVELAPSGQVDALAPTVSLANGVAMPAIGLGTWPMDDAEAAGAVARAIGRGYRLIDTAQNYGNEAGVGAGVRASGVAREEIFLTTKFNRAWHSVAGVREACEASLKRLGMDYIDLYLIHWPNPDQDRYLDAFHGLQRVAEAGLVRAIGVSNFKPAHLARLLDAGLVPQVNQIQLDPYHPRADIVAIHQDDADHYRIEQAVTTRPFARTMAYDPQRQAIFTVTAEGVVDPAQPVNTGPARFYPNAYFPGSMVVLTYAPTRK